MRRNSPVENLKISIWVTFLSVWCWVDLSGAQQEGKPVSITYLSAENVYLDGGRDAGISIGDTLVVRRNQEKIAEIKILYIAEHTSSGKFIVVLKDPKIGEQVELPRVSSEVKEVPLPVIIPQQPVPARISPKQVSGPIQKISGNLSFQWYQFIDQSPYRHDFNQPAVRFNLKALNLWNRPYNLRIRLRSRYDTQTHTLLSDPNQQAQHEWRNRIYEVSFSYDNPQAPINFRVGRIISNTFSGVGYIDGAMLQHNLSSNYHWGIFAGTQPQWQYSDFQTTLQKYGLYANFQKGEYTDGFRIEAALALVGEYHYSDISREYVYVQSAYNNGKYVSLFQNAEIDVNRYWRRDKTGQSVSISSLLLSGNFYLTDYLSAGISYDHRHNYYTYELRSLADSLFDSALRQGVRSTLYLRIMSNFRLALNVGLNHRQNDAKSTYSYMLNLTRTNLLISGSMLSARVAGFSNLFTQGYTPSLLIGKNFNRGHSIDIAYGYYFYKLDIDQSQRSNSWLRSTVQLVLPAHLFLYGQYQYDWGDDRRSHTISFELGYHF